MALGAHLAAVESGRDGIPVVGFDNIDEARFAVPASEVHTAPARPYSVWLAISIASCSVEKVSTVITGPKPSSTTAGMIWRAVGTWLMTDSKRL